ncbi:MAG TPA: flavodoxin family protein [Lachnospiraceae bacterium]|jgi:NAD(P)H-dependent FMN reductase|nr:putative iron-sulfur flavoprotein [Butyrivibrio sp. CAG:318]HJI32255.1 flavodoxin family protein [Lachnospiraceae bacterium]
MKTLIINGSLKGEASHSYMVASRFARGIEATADAQTEVIELKNMNISHCVGCFGCWKVTPGQCVIRDDMDIIRDKIMESDNIILSFPLYFFGVSSKMKTMLDRLLPFKMPYKGRHATEDNLLIMDYRYDFSDKRLILVSSCAHSSTDIVYDSVTREFDMICGKDNYTKVFCPQGEILELDQMKPILNKYLNGIEDAGKEFGINRKLSEETARKVCAPLIPVRAVEKMMTGYWENYPQ